MPFCNSCKLVVGFVGKRISKLGISFIAISSNDIERYPQDAPDLMKKIALHNKYPFPYLYDESQEVANAYDATCTPDIFVFDKELKSYYHGQLDSSRPGNGIPLTGEDIKHALNLLLESQPYQGDEKPSVGCGIKWK